MAGGALREVGLSGFTMSKAHVRLLECGCCGQFHLDGPLLPGGSANYRNDCRYDANRFAGAEDYEARTGLPAIEVWLDEQEEDSNG